MHITSNGPPSPFSPDLAGGVVEEGAVPDAHLVPHDIARLRLIN